MQPSSPRFSGTSSRTPESSRASRRLKASFRQSDSRPMLTSGLPRAPCGEHVLDWPHDGDPPPDHLRELPRRRDLSQYLAHPPRHDQVSVLARLRSRSRFLILTHSIGLDVSWGAGTVKLLSDSSANPGEGATLGTRTGRRTASSRTTQVSAYYWFDNTCSKNNTYVYYSCLDKATSGSKESASTARRDGAFSL